MQNCFQTNCIVHLYKNQESQRPPDTLNAAHTAQGAGGSGVKKEHWLWS